MCIHKFPVRELALDAPCLEFFGLSLRLPNAGCVGCVELGRLDNIGGVVATVCVRLLSGLCLADVLLRAVRRFLITQWCVLIVSCALVRDYGCASASGELNSRHLLLL